MAESGKSGGSSSSSSSSGKGKSSLLGTLARDLDPSSAFVAGWAFQSADKGEVSLDAGDLVVVTQRG